MIDSKIKLSIIVPMYNTGKYINKCLDSLINQTYNNLEIIVVNDCSEDNGYNIVCEYMSKDERIKCICHEENKGPYQARISGAEMATGDYIAFLDSDDYVSIDFYRTLMYSIVENDSDIAIGNTVLEYDNGRKIIYNLFNTNFEMLKGNQCIKKYFKQEGLCFSWHTVWNKIYSKKIWDKAMKHYSKIKSHLVMTDDFACSTVLFYYAKKVTKVENDAVFYCKHENTSTDSNNISISKFKKNLSDMTTSFNFVENFMKEVNIYNTYKENFMRWKVLYKHQQLLYLKWSGLESQEVQEITKLINKFCSYDINIKNEDYFSSIETIWDDRLEKIKNQIARKDIECVSFNIFGTLILRPFYYTTDLFVMLNKYYQGISDNNTEIDFARMRADAELLARNEFKNKYQDVTIDEIYMVIKQKYHIEESILKKMRQKEEELELKYSTRRNTGYELYEMAKSLNKKIILVADIYLDKNTIQRIISKNGYDDIFETFLSSDLRKTKKTGDLYREVCKKMKLNPEKILHVGDDYYTDIEIPKKDGFNVEYMKKTIDVFSKYKLADVFTKDLPDWQDNKAAINFIGIRTMIAVVANKYFDNPYKAFNEESIFNADPYLIGYYALGMHLFGISKWLAEDILKQKYSKAIFIANNSYLPMKAYNILKNIYSGLPESEYFYVSNESIIQASIFNEENENEVGKIKKFFNEIFIENACIFDVNNDTKIEMYISRLLDISLDTYLININRDDALKYAKIGKFNLKTFFNYKPAIIGEVRNVLLSDMYSSCIGYDVKCENVTPIFKEDHYYYPELLVISEIQQAALDFINDYINIFNEDILDLEYQNYYISMPHEEYLQSPTEIDKKVLSCVYSKQKSVGGDFVGVLQIWNDEIKSYNQHNIEKLINFSKVYEDYKKSQEKVCEQITIIDNLNNKIYEDNRKSQEIINEKLLMIKNLEYEMSLKEDIKTHDEIKEEAKQLILQGKGKFSRIIYYLFFDRATLKNRYIEIFYNHKFVITISKKIYKLIKKFRRKRK